MSHMTANQWKHFAREAAMGNGTGTESLWMQILAKHGPWALGCTVLCIAFYTFALQPMASDREMFVEAIQQSVLEQTQSWRAIADSTEKIAESVAIQQQTMDALQTVVLEISADTITNETRKMLEEFVENIPNSQPSCRRSLRFWRVGHERG